MSDRGVEAPPSRFRPPSRHRPRPQGRRSSPPSSRFGMFLPLIGFRAVQDIHNELVLETRWPLLRGVRRLAIAGRAASWTRSSSRRGARDAARRAAQGRDRARAGSRAQARSLAPLRDRLRRRLSADRAGDRRPRRRGEMGRQFRHPDPDLRDARLGPQHRRRPRRPARSRLRRLLCGRRLFLRAAVADLRPVVLHAAAARRHPRRVLGHPARLSGAAAARRLSRHRHARLRRDHPAGADQLGAGHQRLCRHHRHPAPDLLRHSLQRQRRGLRRDVRPRVQPDLPHDLPLLRDPRARRCSPPSSRCGCAGCRSGAPGRRCARTRSPAARSASTPRRPSSRRSRSAPCSAASPARSSPRGRASSRRNPSPSWNRRRSSPSSCSAAWAASSASSSPPSS